MVLGFRITAKETKQRVGYILLGVFAYYLVDPLKGFLDNFLGGMNPLLVGVAGILAVLYFWEF